MYTDGTHTFPNLCVLGDHPLIQHKLACLRDKHTQSADFRRLLHELTYLMGYEVTRFLPTVEVEIETAWKPMKTSQIDQKNIVIVPILRAGLGMSEPLRNLLPYAREGHIGVYRHPKTKEAVEYLANLPEAKGRLFILVDPALATANSASHAVKILNKCGVSNDHILFLSVIAAPEGVQKMLQEHPAVRIFTGALDEKLNKHAYIVPGLGDAGDRLFGTDGAHA